MEQLLKDLFFVPRGANTPSYWMKWYIVKFQSRLEIVLYTCLLNYFVMTTLKAKFERHFNFCGESLRFYGYLSANDVYFLVNDHVQY